MPARCAYATQVNMARVPCCIPVAQVPVEDAVRLLRIMWVLLYDDSFDWALNEARRGLRPIEVRSVCSQAM